jgi:hypothetical protein
MNIWSRCICTVCVPQQGQGPCASLISFMVGFLPQLAGPCAELHAQCWKRTIRTQARGHAGMQTHLSLRSQHWTIGSAWRFWALSALCRARAGAACIFWSCACLISLHCGMDSWWNPTSGNGWIPTTQLVESTDLVVGILVVGFHHLFPSFQPLDVTSVMVGFQPPRTHNDVPGGSSAHLLLIGTHWMVKHII